MSKKYFLMYALTVIFFTAFTSNIFAQDIEFSADDGLEWNQSNMTISASQNASITRDGLNLTADKITVFYRNAPVKSNNQKSKKSVAGDAEIFLIKAENNVRGSSPKENIIADYVEYNLDNGIMTVKPITNSTKMTAYDAEIFADGNIIYYEAKNYATVEKSRVIHSGRTLSSDTMRLDFDKVTNEKDKTKMGLGLSKIQATGNLTIKDKAEVLTGDIAEYNNKTGIVSIDGNVQLSQGGGSKLQGGKIEYDMNTGIAKLLPDPAFGKVIGIFKSIDTSINKSDN
ncbi:MAG: hypothetical protein LBU68_01315 [Rickettsiales bacterium]|jgi:lipopolysaccharide export system protein LptA|nr:hypothetical protein [Rickettsiales bacterium]